MNYCFIVRTVTQRDAFDLNTQIFVRTNPSVPHATINFATSTCSLYWHYNLKNFNWNSCVPIFVQSSLWVFVRTNPSVPHATINFATSMCSLYWHYNLENFNWNSCVPIFVQNSLWVFQCKLPLTKFFYKSLKILVYFIFLINFIFSKFYFCLAARNTVYFTRF